MSLVFHVLYDDDICMYLGIFVSFTYTYVLFSNSSCGGKHV